MEIGFSKKYNQIQITNGFMIFFLRVILLFLLQASSAQQVQYKGLIETRKLFLFGPDNGFEFSSLNKIHGFSFERNFDSVPRVGLGVYTIDFEYSPDFSCQVTSGTSKTRASIRVSSMSENKNNRIYIMYIATDHEQMGIFVPEQLYTSDLSLPGRKKNLQEFDFNFKEQVVAQAQTYNDIMVSIYLTGLSMTSEMTTNGFSTNRSSISLNVQYFSTKFYTIQVQIANNFEDVLLDWIQCTVLYFIPNQLINNRYQINSGSVTLKGYGGTVAAATQSIDLLPLQPNQNFQNLKFFYGISQIQCKDGQNIALLGVEKIYTGSDNSIRLLLEMQTWKLTLMYVSSYNYIQYKQLRCTQNSTECTSRCSKDLKPYFINNGECTYCHYSCLTCDISNSGQFCDTCHSTRNKNLKNNLCDCKSNYYDTRVNYTCDSCYPCATCQKANLCTSCLKSENMILNTVTSECQCKSGFYTNLELNNDIIVDGDRKLCLKCGQKCLYCKKDNQCMACDVQSYLMNGICWVICGQKEIFQKNKNSCFFYQGDLFDQQGRLDFDFSLSSTENQILIDLIFSQPKISFHYYENATGYTYDQYFQDPENLRNIGSDIYSAVIYDDGKFSAGYNKTRNFQLNTIQSSLLNDSATIDQFLTIDDSALRGQYYGNGQKRFFQLLYQNYSFLYRDQNFIPHGKYQLSDSSPIQNPNFIDALSSNLVLNISAETLPYQIQGLSNNHFVLKTRPARTYINTQIVLQIKNPGLIRSGGTALQKKSVSKPLQRFDYYTQQQLSNAFSIKSNNKLFVDILWGISKYLLFIGFGWPFLPLMLALQIIMSFNYIKSQLPVNLEYFLESFLDFRNPSIFFNPLRNQIDQSILTHENIYKSIQEFQKYDRGLDFMKNCFQFFFVPFLSFLLLSLLFSINLVFKRFLRRDFYIISKFLIPRAPLQIAAYTLIQSIPVSFFFFAQINDTTFHHSLSPSGSYPTFNTAMGFLGFFLTCTIPILLMAGLYYHFNYGSRISKFSDANIFSQKLLKKMDNQSGEFGRAQLGDALWGGKKQSTETYIFGIGIYAFCIFSGFFICFFIKSFVWQISGILLFSVLFLGFMITFSFFQNKIIQLFFILFMLFIICYLLLHAGITSNRSMGTYDQWNTGYLAVALIYAFLFTSIFFSLYLAYNFFKEMYKISKSKGWWINVDKMNDLHDQNKEVQRVAEYRKDIHLKSGILRNHLTLFAQSQIKTNMLAGAQKDNRVIQNIQNKVNILKNQGQIPPSTQRITNSQDEIQINLQKQEQINQRNK